MADFQVTGNIRIPNAAAILMRGQNDNNDFTALSSDASANLLIGHASMPNIFFVDGPVIHIPSRLEMADGARLAWGSGGDVSLWRDGQWQLGLRDGLNDMFFYVYGTFTDASNYERLALYAGSSTFHFLEPQSAGSGNVDINLTVRALGAGVLELGAASANPTGQMDLYASRYVVHQPNSSQTRIETASQLLTMSSGQSVTATNIIPADVLLLGITTRAVTPVTGPAGYDVGDGVDVDRWGNSIATPSGQSSIGNYTTSAITYFTALTSVVITSDGVDFTGGTIRVIAHYIRLVGGSS